MTGPPGPGRTHRSRQAGRSPTMARCGIITMGGEGDRVRCRGTPTDAVNGGEPHGDGTGEPQGDRAIGERIHRPRWEVHHDGGGQVH